MFRFFSPPEIYNYVSVSSSLSGKKIEIQVTNAYWPSRFREDLNKILRSMVTRTRRMAVEEHWTFDTSIIFSCTLRDKTFVITGNLDSAIEQLLVNRIINTAQANKLCGNLNIQKTYTIEGNSVYTHASPSKSPG